ncbi:MAG: CPBP family intramembrane metalloprotease [Erysipelotrichaceae bacterium]|nr:CPBP family intramembrane metalloprotease [Erysipelotrichaceae bacterium]
MKKLYIKNELAFSLLWIGIYIVSLSAADGISIDLGIEKVLTAPLCLVLSGFLYIWISKMNLKQVYGLVYPHISLKSVLYYIPLVLIVSVNLWSGVQLNYTVFESFLYVISMVCVGFLEEIIFRGFLFKALAKDNLLQAIIISSVSFGLGHIINLLNGSDFIPTLLQIAYAISAGYLFTILFHTTGSLIPCIVTHSLLNSLSAFTVEQSALMDYCSAIFLMIVPLCYAWYIQRYTKRPQ